MLEIVICSVFLGIIITLFMQYLIIKRWFFTLPLTGPPRNSQYERYALPKELLDIIEDPEKYKDKKETCLCLNLIFQFLFRELKDTKRVRRWVVNKMNVEFEELLTMTTAGKLLERITARDFSLGETFPVVRNVSLDSTVTKDDTLLEEVSILVDLVYNGGFQLSLDVDIVFGKTAFFCIKVTKLCGLARLQLTRDPYTHWSFSFVGEPTLELDIDSQFEGVALPQVTSLISSQIQKTVRKKHTLPNYKIRYKPFFLKPEPIPPCQDIYYNSRKLSAGSLNVHVIECSRLVNHGPSSKIYCTLSVDTLPWEEQVRLKKKQWKVLEVEIVKLPGQQIGMTFREKFLLERFEEMIAITSVTITTPAHKSGVRKNDVILAVNGIKVASSKHAAKLIRQAGERFTMRIERLITSQLHQTQSGSDLSFKEETYSLKDYDMQPLNDDQMTKDEHDEYINITIASNEDTVSNTCTSPPKNKALLSEGPVVVGMPTGVSPSKKPFSILSTSASLFQRKRGNGENRDVISGSEQKTKSPSDVMDSDSQGKSTSELDSMSIKTSEKTHSQGSFAMEATESLTDLGPNEEPYKLDGPVNTNMRKTAYVRGCKDPIFNEEFEFAVDSEQSYLNICVWCQMPRKLDKQNREISPPKHSLMGYVSVPLMDIALECMATLQGDTQQTYQLMPTDQQMKAFAAHPKIVNLATHRGFEQALCYGDITLAFEHNTLPQSKTERERILKISASNEEAMRQSQEASRLHSPARTLKEGEHSLILTHFQSATYCNFCHKKIWFKTAYRCEVCDMVCHKKCMEKCQSQTLCSNQGFKIINGNNMSPLKPDAMSPKDQISPPRTSLFSKFRKLQDTKESPRGSPQAQRKSLPRTEELAPPVERKRANSAADLSATLKDGAAGLDDLSLGGAEIHRTRSSDSLNELSKDGPSGPFSRKRIEFEESDSSSEDEMNLLKFFDKNKPGTSSDENVVTAAKEMGKDLYADMMPTERQEKLEGIISKLQIEIDVEAESLASLARQRDHMRGPELATKRQQLELKMAKTEEKVQSLALLMLHYCAGLQDCMNQQEMEKLRPKNEDHGIQGDQVDDLEEFEISVDGYELREGTLRPGASYSGISSVTNQDRASKLRDLTIESSGSHDEFHDSIGFDAPVVPTTSTHPVDSKLTVAPTEVGIVTSSTAEHSKVPNSDDDITVDEKNKFDNNEVADENV